MTFYELLNSLSIFELNSMSARVHTKKIKMAQNLRSMRKDKKSFLRSQWNFEDLQIEFGNWIYESGKPNIRYQWIATWWINFNVNLDKNFVKMVKSPILKKKQKVRGFWSHKKLTFQNQHIIRQCLSILILQNQSFSAKHPWYAHYQLD